MNEADPKCTCPKGDFERCIDGAIYAECSSEHCGGVCEYAGPCDCPVHHQGDASA